MQHFCLTQNVYWWNLKNFLLTKVSLESEGFGRLERRLISQGVASSLHWHKSICLGAANFNNPLVSLAWAEAASKVSGHRHRQCWQIAMRMISSVAQECQHLICSNSWIFSSTILWHQLLLNRRCFSRQVVGPGKPCSPEKNYSNISTLTFNSKILTSVLP